MHHLVSYFQNITHIHPQVNFIYVLKTFLFYNRKKCCESGWRERETTRSLWRETCTFSRGVQWGIREQEEMSGEIGRWRRLRRRRERRMEEEMVAKERKGDKEGDGGEGKKRR